MATATATKPFTVTFEVEGEDLVKLFKMSIGIGLPIHSVAKQIFLENLRAPAPDYSVSWDDLETP